MRNILICTVGTSLAGNLSRLDAQDPMRKAWDEDNLKTVASQIISKKPDERICGAEINSVASICKENKLDELLSIVLLVSDTDDGRRVGQTLKHYYDHPSNPYKFKKVETPRVLKGLNDKSVSAFQRDGLRNLVREISQEVRQFSPENIVINATGGYKAQISFAGMIGQAFTIPVYYLFEKFSKVIELPPQPVSLDLSLWLNHYSIFEELENKQQLPKEQVLDDLKDIPLEAMLDEVELDDVGYVALSAMGQLFHERCRLEFAKQETTLLGLVPTTDLAPSKKTTKLRDDHGKDLLQAFATKLCESPYVQGIINSLPFNPKVTYPIKRAEAGGLVEFVLTWTDPGYGLCIQTTGRTKAETNTIALHLAKKFSK